MLLQDIHDIAASRSYFSRPDPEVWMAINSASRVVYQSMLKEDMLFFRVLDTASVTIVPNTQEYALPQGCIQILRLRERVNAQDTWRRIEPIDPREDEAMDDFPAPQISFPGGSSTFTFQGPYLNFSVADDGTDDETYSIWINPVPQDTRQVEIMYVAKLPEVAKGTDPFIIPHDLRDIVLDLSSAELLRGNNDDLSDKYASSGMAKLSVALELVRDRQLEHLKTVTPYLYEYL